MNRRQDGPAGAADDRGRERVTDGRRTPEQEVAREARQVVLVEIDADLRATAGIDAVTQRAGLQMLEEQMP